SLTPLPLFPSLPLPPLISTLFPYTTLFRSLFRSSVRQNFLAREVGIDESILSKIIHGYREPSKEQRQLLANYLAVEETWLFEKLDRKSTRLNSSHVSISYAVFCLKKKKIQK